MLRTQVPASRPLCRNIASQGFCQYGRRCHFSHDPRDQASRPPPEKIPCFSWEDTGSCPYGNRCAYLHRSLELVGSAPLQVGLRQVVSGIERHKRADRRASVTLSDFQDLASYDWLRTLHPTIAVPGKCAERAMNGSD